MNLTLEIWNQYNKTSVTNYYNSSENFSTIEYTVEYCQIPKDFNNLNELFKCYEVFFKTRFDESFLELGLAIGTVFFNLLVALLILTKPVKLSVFDKILVGHCIVDGVTGLIDIPLYHVSNFFGYWPFGKVLSLMWASYDNNINTTTNLHMLYMSWVRLRSIQAPKAYNSEFLIKRPALVMLCFWLFSLGVWVPTTFLFGTIDYTTDVNFEPEYIKVIYNSTIWFIPLFSILIVASYIIYYLQQRDRRKKHMANASSKANITMTLQNTLASNMSDASKPSTYRKVIKYLYRFRLSGQTKFMIIIWVYWFEWAPPCFVTILNPLCGNCVPPDITGAIYWLTYTVCLFDPLVVLILNPNVSCMRKAK